LREKANFLSESLPFHHDGVQLLLLDLPRSHCSPPGRGDQEGRGEMLAAKLQIRLWRFAGWNITLLSYNMT